MYEDSNRNKMDVIVAYLILYYDINDEKAAKLMTIAKSNIDEKSKSAPSNTFFSKIYLQFILHSQYRGCWCSGDAGHATSRGSNNHVIDQVLPEYHCFGTSTG